MQRGTSHRVLRWLWTSRRMDARLFRLALLPLSGVWKLAMSARNLGYDLGWRSARGLPLPAIGIGNLTAGGAGKTPVAGWVAAHFAARGIRPAILTSGYGRDEALLHRERLPEALVLGDRDRVRTARQVREQGAGVLILDDAFQLRSVARDFNLVVVSAESSRAVRWPLPAGPWREGWTALRRADGLVVTRKRASLEAARAHLERLRPYLKPGAPAGLLRLEVSRYQGLTSGGVTEAGSLQGKRVVAACAIADPDSFVAQTKATGALVQVATWPDHHDFQDEDLAWLAKAARKADFLVVTQKDAVKLRGRWPASVPEPLVAILDLVWEAGEGELTAALDAGVPRERPPC
jgi:tetraacyldisaccharide 4'-kinase